MIETSARLLRMLSLLQTRRDWASADLAERLGVAVRTVRRDVERLRSLGYPVHATPGVSGGYRLGAGATMPPLLLDDEEAVAVAIGLRTAGGGVTGIEETAARALAKLEQVLPARLRHRAGALQAFTIPIAATGPTVDADVLTAITGACRDHEQLRFDYRRHDGTESVRKVEPHRLVHTGRRWYLVGWDIERQDWRTFRADRITPRIPTGPRFTPREIPGGDTAEFVARGLGSAMWRYRATVRLHVPAEAVKHLLPPPVAIEPVDEHSCLMHAGADTFDVFLTYLAMLDVDFDVVEPPELLVHLRKQADRYVRAIGRHPAS